MSGHPSRRPPDVHVLVLGAAGRTGRLVVGEALAAGHRVTALVRSPTAAFESHERLQVVVGDSRSADDLTRAGARHGAIVCAVGTSSRDSHGLYAQTARAVVRAAPTLGVARVVAITSSGVRGHDPHHPWWYRTLLAPLMRATYLDMAELETTLANSGLAWTVVRPGRLTDGPQSGAVRVGDGENPPGGVSVPRADLARFIVSVLDDERWLHRCPTLTR